jgi:HSP20 family protein
MDLIRWSDTLADPFPEFETLQDEINRLFDTTRWPESRGLYDRAYSPPVDVMETADAYGVVCDLPGMDIKDIDLSVAENVLTLKGEKRRQEKKPEASVYMEELASGRFQRTLSFPLAVDADKVEAVLKDGVLTVTLPKKEEVKPKQVTVKAK